MKKTLGILLMLAGTMIAGLACPGSARAQTFAQKNIAPSVVNQPIGAWIIIAGDRSDHDQQAGIISGCNRVYNHLLAMGFLANQIMYLGPVWSGIVSNFSTRANIHTAISHWAATKVNAAVGLGIYMEDHGGNRFMCIPGGVYNGTHFKNDLAELESTSGCRRAIIIYDACDAGSIITDISAPERIILTSTDATHNAYGNPRLGMTTFSCMVWSSLRANNTVGQAFIDANYALRGGSLWDGTGPAIQYPWIDDNHDRVGHEAYCSRLPVGGDGVDALNIKIQRSTLPIIVPVIIVVPLCFYINISVITFPIWGVIQNASELSKVYATINPRIWTPVPANNDSEGYIRPTLPEMETINLTDQDGDGNYTGDFSAASLYEGDFRIELFAEGVDGGFAQIARTYCTVNQNGTAPADTTPPLVGLLNPRDGDVVNGVVNISAAGDDNRALQAIQLYIDDTLVETKNMPANYPYPEATFAWDTTQYSEGSHNVTAVAYDLEGQQNSTTAIVTVQNTVPIPADMGSALLAVAGCAVAAITFDVIKKIKKKD
nr:Ig-like domain-containing protein [Candidatus Sigynarchaeota archaeon]